MPPQPFAPSLARPVPRRLLLGVVAATPLVRFGAALAGAQSATSAAGTVPADPTLPAGEPRAEGPLRVVATTGILADLARQVGGPRVEARSVLPANADPHDFEPTPQDVAAIDGADLLIAHGLGLDAWAAPLIAAVPGDRVVTASDGVLLRETAGGAGADPHWWFDPTRTATAVGTIADGLAAVDPAGEATFRARAETYVTFLTELDAAIRAAIDTIPPERRKLVTNHDNLGYYADRYGLAIVGAVIPGLATTAEPSAADIAAMLDAIARAGVPVIFAENTTSPALAESLAAEAGVTVVDGLYTDALGPAGSGADTYAGLMRTDTAIIVGALR